MPSGPCAGSFKELFDGCQWLAGIFDGCQGLASVFDGCQGLGSLIIGSHGQEQGLAGVARGCEEPKKGCNLARVGQRARLRLTGDVASLALLADVAGR